MAMTFEDIERARQMYAGQVPTVPVVAPPMPVEISAPAPVAAPPGRAPSPWKTPEGFDEAAFQRDIRVHPWYTQFQQKYGEAPNLEDPDYDYRSAWAAGIRPEIYKHDGTYHWSSSLPSGQMLKSENHPTAWMEHFMRATGTDPNDLGLKSKEEGDAYLARMKQRPAAAQPSRDQELLQQKPVQAPAQPQMNLSNWRGEMLKAYDANSAAQQNVARETANALDRASVDTQVLGAMHEEDLRASTERQKLIDDGWKQERAALVDQWNALNDQANNSVISDRRSVKQKAMGALALGLGQATDQNNLVAGLMQGVPVQTHNADSIQDNINATIDRDIDIQRMNLQNKRAAADAKYSQLGMARQFFGDDTAAEQFVRSSQKEEFGLAMEQIANTLGNDVAKQRAIAVGEQNKLEGQQGKAQLLAQLEAQRKAEAAARAAARAKGPDYSKFTREEIEAALLQPGGAPQSLEEFYRVKYVDPERKAAADDAALASKKIGDQKTQAEIAKLEAEARGGGGHMSDGDKKLARLAQGIEPAVAHLAPYLSSGKDIPYLGVAETGPAKALGAVIPEAFTPNENLAFRSSVDAVANVLLRDESGAALPPAEVASKKASWGIGSGSHEMRKEGLRRMLIELAARKANGSLPPTIDAQPVGGQPVADGR